MKRSIKSRILALLLTLCMAASLCLGFAPEASAAGSIRNSGIRHQICTQLSRQAEDYYGGEYDWDTMSKLDGKNTSSSLAAMDSELYDELNELMSDTMTSSVSYKSLTSYWTDTDASANGGQIIFYSDIVSNENVNREHVWPKSRASFYQKGGGCDLHHLRPTTGNVNSTRSNYTMGEVTDKFSDFREYSFGGHTVLYYMPSADLVEVNDNIKGDVARILLYVYVRWEQPNLCENVSGANLPKLDSDDDADDGLKVIESLDTLLEWCEEDPVDTWEMSRNDCTQNIQGNRNVFIDYPEYAWLLFDREVPDDMTTPSGEASHTVDKPDPDPTPCTLSFSAPEQIDSIVGLKGASVSLPSCSAAPEGYEFIGWSKVSTEETTVNPGCLNAGASYTLNDDTTLYALFSRTEEGGDVGGDAQLVTSERSDWSGRYVFAFSGKVDSMMSNDNSSGTYLAKAEAIITDNKITNASESNIFTVSKLGDYYTIQDCTGAYLKCSGLKKISLDSGKISVSASDTAYLWSFSSERISCANSAYGILQFNASSPRFTTYAESSRQNDLSLYLVGQGKTTYYTTDYGQPVHTHDYTATVTAPTCTDKGYTTHTCDCGDSYKDNFVKALGHDYKNGVCTVCGDKDPSYSHVCPFDDIADSAHHTNIETAYERGYVSGYGEGEYAPNETVTRAQFITMLWRAAGKPAPASTNLTFMDISETDYCREAIAWGAEKGIVSGYDANTFGRNDPVTRAQATTFIARYCDKVVGMELNSSDYGFLDINDAREAFRPYINAMANAGIILGYGTTCGPNDKATRGQIASILVRAMDTIG